MSEAKIDDALIEKIINVAKKNPKGISNKDISAAIPELSTTELVSAINKLLQQGLFDLYEQGGSLLYNNTVGILWLGHVVKMGEDRSVKQGYLGRPDGRGPVGRPEYRWSDRVEADLRQLQARNWQEIAQIRDKWRALALDAKTHFGLQRQQRKYKAQSSKPTVTGDNEEKVVFNLIEEAGNKGIWMRDIRMRSNLAITQVTKVLKNLEGKRAIKAVKCVNASKRKVYMLFNLEPDQSISGGPWYQDQDFESEYVDILNRQCLRFLQQRADKIKNNVRGPIVGRTQSFASAAEVQKYITDLKISNETLTVEHVVTILNTLVYDGKAESSVYPDGNKVFRAIESLIPAPGLVQVPCGVCPLIYKCFTDGLINPQGCKYMDEWLEQQ